MLNRRYQIKPVSSTADILPEYLDTPVEEFLRYHNLGDSLPARSGQPRLLIGMCMDNRKDLTVPKEFAYVLRSAGANMKDSGFEISFAVAVGGVNTIVVLTHTDCGMTNVINKRDQFVAGLVQRGGWTEDAAVEHFERFAPKHEIGDPVAFVMSEAKRLRREYPAVLVASLLYTVEDDRLSQVIEAGESEL
jgi:carbonic anhydrase